MRINQRRSSWLTKNQVLLLSRVTQSFNLGSTVSSLSIDLCLRIESRNTLLCLNFRKPAIMSLNPGIKLLCACHTLSERHAVVYLHPEFL